MPQRGTNISTLLKRLKALKLEAGHGPVVSIPNGAQGTANSITENLDRVLTFEEVILMFNQDEPGREVATFFLPYTSRNSTRKTPEVRLGKH